LTELVLVICSEWSVKIFWLAWSGYFESHINFLVGLALIIKVYTILY